MSNPSITSAPAALTADERLAAVEKRLAAIERRANDAARAASEAVWAQVFHDTIRGSSWLKNQTFSPGRSAVGYQYLYVLYRVLDGMKPKCILDLGLGQTTKMIAQYAAANSDVQHIVVESEPSWIEFFKPGFPLPKNTRIIQLPYAYETFHGAKGVRVYKRFKQALREFQFDFISIDAPFGMDMKEYARIDSIKLFPDGLVKRYAILIDDTDRPADRNMKNLLQSELRAHGFTASSGRYLGAKECQIIVSDDLAYLKTL